MQDCPSCHSTMSAVVIYAQKKTKIQTNYFRYSNAFNHFNAFRTLVMTVIWLLQIEVQ